MNTYDSFSDDTYAGGWYDATSPIDGVYFDMDALRALWHVARDIFNAHPNIGCLTFDDYYQFTPVKSELNDDGEDTLVEYLWANDGWYHSGLCFHRHGSADLEFGHRHSDETFGCCLSYKMQVAGGGADHA